ncbi:uncharacterized protein LOC128548900 [Mercenaria mercenaria]|uniref:uncharacterized protein LOC128548900 n=1 Tax=Mercenaria mercenaria TaxID=6596 RepID=UPI00234E94F9|nr:uncharacterized protein LOC128548900 [Mercenaria mercenaria]
MHLKGYTILTKKGLKQNHSPPYIVGPSCDTTPPAVISGKGSTITVTGSGNALGQQIPPYFIFPGKRMRQELLTGCIPGTAGTVSDSGWSNSEIFMDYLTNHFIKYVQGRDEEKTILVLYDGHRSHISLPLIDWAKQHRIQLFVLPAHTSHVLQTLDLGCFGPFERMYNAECHKYMRMNSLAGIDRHCICQLACKTYLKALSPENLQSSFRKAGIFPFEPAVVDKSQFVPAKVLNTTETHTREQTDNTSDKEKSTEVQAKSSSVQYSHDNFFKDRETQIGKQDRETKKRKCLSSVVSGKPIPEECTIQKIQQHQQSVRKSSSSSLSMKKQSTYRTTSKKAKILSSDPQPGTSGIAAPANKKKSVKQLPSQSDYSSDDEITDEEKCCQCKLFQPTQIAMSNTIYFTKWGQCMFDNCRHWTHLKYCCNVVRLRGKDTFYCPCHGVPCTTVEE